MVMVVATLALAGVLLPVAGDAEACASSHGLPLLRGFPGWPNVGSPFYPVVEGAGQMVASVGVTPGHCVTQGGSSAQYTTEPGSAAAPEDFTARSGTVSGLCDDVDTPSFCQNGHKPQENVSVSIANDSDPLERAVESFRFTLTNGQPFGLAAPSAAPVHIIDDDGAARVSLEPTLTGEALAYQQTEFGSILIPVFWAGSTAPGSVPFTVGAGPGNAATPGEDFTVATPSPLSIPSSRFGFIRLDVVGDKLGEGDESLTITIEPGAGYTVDQPSSTTLTILDNEENIFPTSRFHHPRNKWKYNKADYRIREFHIFATDEGGSGVVAAEMALRRNLANGKCAWKVKKGWQKKDCDNKTWLSTKYDDVGELFYNRMNQLKSSVGTKIKNYTAFSRAIDGAGNVEKEFSKKRNMNTFEIRGKGKTQKA